MPTSNAMEVVAGSASAWDITILDGAGNPITTSPPIAAALWQGGSTSVLATPAVAWSNPAAGVATMTLTAAQSAALAVGWYRVTDTVTILGQPYTAATFNLEVKPSAGSTALGTVYCQYTDMLRYAGDWLPRLATKFDETGFANQRSRARSWLDDIIIAKARPGTMIWMPSTAGLDATFFEPDAPNYIVRGWLASNYLIVRDITVEIVARKAISYACELGAGVGESGGQYDELSARYAYEAAQLVRSYRVEIDLNGDGYSDQAWHLGVMSSRLL